MTYKHFAFMFGLAFFCIALLCPDPEVVSEDNPARSYLAPSSSFDRKGLEAFVGSSSRDEDIQMDAEAERIMLEREAKKARKEPIAMMDKNTINRWAKLANQTLEEAMADLLQTNLIGKEVYYDVPGMPGYYFACKFTWRGILHEQIWIKPSLVEVVKKIARKIGAELKLTELQVQRIVDYFHLYNIVHETQAQAVLESYKKIPLGVLRKEKDPVEGEYFEALVEGAFIRNMPQEDFYLMMKMQDYVRSTLKYEEHQWLKKWRKENMTDEVFIKMLNLEEEGIEWFEMEILPFFGKERHHDGRYVSEVVRERKAKFDKTKKLKGAGIWEPILRRDLLESIAKYSGFKETASKVVKVADLRTRRRQVLNAIAQAQKARDLNAFKSSARGALGIYPVFRVLQIVSKDSDIEPMLGLADKHPSLEIAVDIGTLVEAKHFADGTWKIQVRHGRAQDMMTALNALYRLLGDAVRVHIFYGNMPEADARKALESMGLKIIGNPNDWNKSEQYDVGILAKDGPALINGIKQLREKMGYEKKYLVSPDTETCFIFDPKNLSPRTSHTAVWDLSAHQKMYKYSAGVTVDKNASLGDAIAAGAVVHLSKPPMWKEPYTTKYPQAKTPMERAVAEMNGWLALTLSPFDLRDHSYTFDGRYGVMHVEGIHSFHRHMLEVIDQGMQVFASAL